MKNLICILSFLISLQTLATDVEIFERDGRHYLRGACEAAADEIKFINPTGSPQCQCSNLACETELTSHLPERIAFTLKHPFLKAEGPNCWNSVLYSKGLDQGLYISDIEFWFSSPLCKAVKGPAIPGDIINIRRKNKATGFFFQSHSFMLISPQVAYNKSSPDKNDPYELVNPEVPFERLNLEGQSLGFDPRQVCKQSSPEEAEKLGCELFSEVYRCEKLDEIFKAGNDKDELLAEREVKALSEISTQASISGVEIKFKPLVKRLRNLRKLALNKLGAMKLYQLHKKALNTSIYEYYNGGFDDVETPTEEEKMLIFTEMLLYASPDMDLTILSPEKKEFVNIFRSKGITSHLPPKTRLFWAQVYWTTDLLQEQFSPKEWE